MITLRFCTIETLDPFLSEEKQHKPLSRLMLSWSYLGESFKEKSSFIANSTLAHLDFPSFNLSSFDLGSNDLISSYLI